MKKQKVSDMASVLDYSEVREEVEKDLGIRTKIRNSRGKVVLPRKFHMTDDQMFTLRDRWERSIVDVDKDIKKRGGSLFFNPYRENGGYYGGVQALFLLGCNVWHTYVEVRNMMQVDMSSRMSCTRGRTSWDKFALRAAREGAASTKDLMGRIIHNFRVLQRLGGLNQYGLKLKQVGACIDVRRDDRGVYEFRLNTMFKDIEGVKPFNDLVSKTVKKEVVGLMESR